MVWGVILHDLLDSFKLFRADDHLGILVFFEDVFEPGRSWAGIRFGFLGHLLDTFVGDLPVVLWDGFVVGGEESVEVDEDFSEGDQGRAEAFNCGEAVDEGFDGEGELSSL